MYTRKSLRIWSPSLHRHVRETSTDGPLLFLCASPGWANKGGKDLPESPTVSTVATAKFFGKERRCHRRLSIVRSRSAPAKVVLDERHSREVTASQSDVSKASSSTSIKSCMKSNDSSSTNRSQKKVSFSVVEIREHARILGDNPAAKKGYPLSIDWFKPETGRSLSCSVDKYERERKPKRKNKKNLVLSPLVRKRILKEEVGVSSAAIYAARQEASKIKESRRHNNKWNFQEIEGAVIVLETCARSLQRLLEGSVSEWEFRELMDQAERAHATR